MLLGLVEIVLNVFFCNLFVDIKKKPKTPHRTFFDFVPNSIIPHEKCFF